MKLVSTDKISVKYGANTVLNNVSMDVSSGEIVTIVGPNGSGKTTLVKTIIGAIKHFDGSLFIKDNLKVGYIPQRLQMDKTLPITVERFLNLTQKISSKECAEVLSAAGMPSLIKSQMADLSGGQFQKVLLARALQGDPDILILDEAAQGLDQSGSADFYRQIENVRNTKGCAVLMISHELHVVMGASDKVICLNGHVCCCGAPEAVAGMPEYYNLFGMETDGALALYKHQHNHKHHIDESISEVSV